MSLDLSFIIVNYNTRDLLEACLASIYSRTRSASFEILVVDNASADGSCDMVRRLYPQVSLIESSVNAGFGAANNMGAARACGRHLVLLNSDALLIADTGSALAAFLDEHPDAGCAGPRIELSDGSPQPRSFGNPPSLRTLFNETFLLSSLSPARFPAIHLTVPGAAVSRVGWVSGVCMALPRDLYLQAGGFDPKFFMYAEDIDLCLRLSRAGYATYHIDDHAVRHLLGGSTKTASAMVRNSVLQQRHFLQLLESAMDKRSRRAAACIIGAGLVLRIAAGSALKLIGRGGLLLNSSLARLRDLAGERGLPCA